MADPFREAKAALESFEQEQRERFRPKAPEQPKTPAEAYAKALDAAQSDYLSVDAGWLR